MTDTAERSYTTVDKSTWGPGPWQDEPDKLQWIDEATGLDCLISRGPSGALCGYVGVPPEHPYHGVAYGGQGWDDNAAPDNIIEVHGGLTYSAACQETDDESTGICHVPAPGHPDDVWWLGFDCAHSGDVTPASDARLMEIDRMPTRFPGDTYRTLGYVQRECRQLAQQLTALSKNRERTER
jgi:hypothetical protein